MSLTIKMAVQAVGQRLASVSSSARLDSEILLAYVLQVPRSYLLAFPERVLTLAETQVLEKLVAERQQNVPIAYLVGTQEFWSLDFLVTPATLIPRPETELLVESLLESVQLPAARIADLGTGSGAIALAVASERRQWEVHATDISTAALSVAQENARRLQIANVTFYPGNWCAALPPLKFMAIVSNPPYIAQDDPYWQTNPSEPIQALVAADHGLSALREIIYTAADYLMPQGYLLLEHGFLQADAVHGLLAAAGYEQIQLKQDLAGLDRVTCAQKP